MLSVYTQPQYCTCLRAEEEYSALCSVDYTLVGWCVGCPEKSQSYIHCCQVAINSGSLETYNKSTSMSLLADDYINSIINAHQISYTSQWQYQYSV